MTSGAPRPPRPPNAYLVLYNTAQLLLWTGAFAATVQALVNRWDVYGHAGLLVKLAQGLSLLEVVHSATGLVRASAGLSFLNWFGRSTVLFGVLARVPEVWGLWSVAPMCLAWSLADAVRLGWYLAALLQRDFYALTWLRYTLFLVLYPVGMFGGEWPIVYTALPFIRERRLGCVDLPNALNFGFGFDVFLRVALYTLMPLGLLYLYTYLLLRRGRKLQGAAARGQKLA